MWVLVQLSVFASGRPVTPFFSDLCLLGGEVELCLLGRVGRWRSSLLGGEGLSRSLCLLGKVGRFRSPGLLLLLVVLLMTVLAVVLVLVQLSVFASGRPVTPFFLDLCLLAGEGRLWSPNLLLPPLRLLLLLAVLLMVGAVVVVALAIVQPEVVLAFGTVF